MNRLCAIFVAIMALSIFCCCDNSESDVTSVDVCVYGGTSASVTAARAAAEEGCDVVIICPDIVLGGMTTGGLGATDIGNKQAIRGMAREFYRALGKHYGTDEQWKFEPHAASEILDSWVDNPKIKIFREYYLAKVDKKGTRIRSITCENASGAKTIKAKCFIDCTYEGDLMAMAGVSYHVGREANSVYGETLNGYQLRDLHQFKDNVDPFVVPGDPSSGLLWGISKQTPRTLGDGDNYVQAYNFRLCLSNDPANQIPFTKPDDYDPARYELLARIIQADPNPVYNMYFGWSLMPNGKTDVNNKGPFSTDMIGMNYEYPDATWERRKEIIQAHKSYTLGLMWFYVSDPRVPASMRDEIKKWGWAKDEYPKTGNWTHQLYIREARRMIGEYVATQADCEGKGNVQDGIGYAAYTMDSHNCERLVIEKDGKLMVKNEGDVQVRGGVPYYPISYRSITPKREECTNLLVPVCLSSSHIAYGSIRMEPVFLELGQVSGMAAAIAGKKPVQTIDITPIQEKVEYGDNPKYK